ncbi:MAG: hypothetical protein JWQ90_1975 [Hydrocarboniphaga sp.]|uniref:tetratricopeptide repeat protein n=1 Tax=Hydrocarboniphaga sp. TaxID=2033016 RepID=UPI002613E07C|nr:tetratricopeptide repeat protein [Hydrocarboniphaga sp.]MDB5969525.1 hypothetical protein [Hydrocarboniphaga sp.]
MSTKPSLLAELQRRHVYKVGAAYTVAGWLLVQVVTQVLPIFEISALVQRIIVLAIIAGFPVALVLAWVFDLTPQGIVRTDELSASDQTPVAIRERRSMDRKLNLMLGALVVLGLAYFAAERAGYVDGRTADFPAAATHDKSIAVLPFDNLSRDPDNAYFAEGIQDEILTRLAKIGALRVISRTSTQQYAAKPGNLPDIARQLGVANIVEGSVQKAGNAVRINVQLIRAASDTHLWADTYDRRLDDLFGVQSEVAGAIATQLDARLSGDEKKDLATPPTTNAGAYDAWLRALVLIHRAEEDPVGVEQGIALLTKATQDDPKFAEAWAQLSRSHGSQYFQSYDQTEARKQSGKLALDQALKLAPASLDTQLAQGYHQYWIERDYASAISTFEALLARWPDNSEGLRALGFIARRQGRFEDSVQLLERALKLDPHDLTLLTETAWTYQQMRQSAPALLIWDRALAVKSGDANLMSNKATLYLVFGHLDEADALLAKTPHDADLPNVVSTLALQAQLRRRYAQGASTLQAMVSAFHGTALQGAIYRASLGSLQLRAGDLAAGKATLTQARDSLQSELVRQPENDVILDQLAQVQAALGERGAAMQTIARAIKLLPTSMDAIYGPWHEETRARIQAHFGEREPAVAALSRLLKIPYAYAITPALLRLDPDWDNLRGDPRFQALVADDTATP